MAVINSLPMTAKFHNADYNRDGLFSKEDKKKLDGLVESFSHPFNIEIEDWSETESGEYITYVDVPGFTSDMYAVVIPSSTSTKTQYYEIADCGLSVRNNSDGTIEITSSKLPEMMLPLNVLYSSNAVMIPVPEVYKEENSTHLFTLRAADWVGNEAPYTQTIVIEDMNASMFGSIALVEDYTPEELRAAILAKIDTTQTGNMITFLATEIKPTVDIRAYIIYGNNVAMSFFPLANVDGFVEAKNVPINNSIIGIDESPKTVEDALAIIWNRLVRTTDGTFTSDKKLEVRVGMCFFDTVLGKPVWCKSKNPYVFVDANGNEVYTV